MSDGAPKTAYELAMERLRKKDEEAGIVRHEVSEQAKAKIADARSFYQAKLAEIELRYQDKANGIVDPAERAELDAEYRRDRERLNDERERKIERIRAEDAKS